MKLTILSTFLRRYNIVIPEFYLKEEFMRIYSESKSERLIEYPLIFSAIPQERKKILDVGCRYSMFPVQLASMGHDVYGIDLYEYRRKHPNFRFIKGDIINYRVEAFDIITAVSTIEHVGLPLAYGKGQSKKDGDTLAVKNIYKSLRKEGIFLMTIPYGKAIDTSWYRVYNHIKLKELLVDFKKVKISLYTKNNDGYWLPSNEKEAKGIDNSKETYGIAFVKAIK